MFKKISRLNEWTLAFGQLLIGIAALCGLATAASGQLLFVANSALGTIGEYNATTGAVINPALITGLNAPLGITISGDDLYVANNGNGTVGEYTISGQVVNASLLSGISLSLGDGRYFPCVNDVAVSGSQVFVSQYAIDLGGDILEYTTSGQFVPSGFVGVQSYGVAVAGQDLFVSDYGTTSSGSMSEWTTDRVFLNQFAVSNPPYGFGLAEPCEVAVTDSDVFVADCGHGNIKEYTMSGTFVQTITNDSGSPYGLAIYGSDLFVTSYNGTVSEYTTSGDLVNDSLISGLGIGDPWGIAVVLPEPGNFGILIAALLYASSRRTQRSGNESSCSLSRWARL